MGTGPARAEGISIRTCAPATTGLGHASITTTHDLYGHLYPGDMDRYADHLGTAIEEASAVTGYVRPV
jgi:hypothetical protein